MLDTATHARSRVKLAQLPAGHWKVAKPLGPSEPADHATPNSIGVRNRCAMACRGIDGQARGPPGQTPAVSPAAGIALGRCLGTGPVISDHTLTAMIVMFTDANKPAGSASASRVLMLGHQ